MTTSTTIAFFASWTITFLISNLMNDLTKQEWRKMAKKNPPSFLSFLLFVASFFPVLNIASSLGYASMIHKLGKNFKYYSFGSNIN